jgi:predicted PurR-regulated permease PerM
MEPHATHHHWQRVVMSFGSLVLVVAALYWAREVLIPVVLAILLTFVLSPFVTGLQHLHLPRVPAALLVGLAALCILGALGLLFYSQLEKLALELPQRKEQIVEKIRSLRESGRGSWLDRFWETFGEIEKETKVAAPASARAEPVPVTVVSGTGPADVLAFASPALGAVIQGLMTFVLVIFMLIKREDLRNRLIRLSGEGRITSMTKALDDAATRLSRFLLAQLIINASFGAAVALGLTLIGVPYAIVWGFLAGALRYIPYIGAYLGMVLPLLLSVVLFPDWTQTLLVLGLFIGLELIISNVVEPWVFGHSIGVSEVALLVALAFWGWLWGAVGLVLSTPLTAMLAVLGKYVPQLEFFDVLLGDEPVLKPYIRYYQRLLARDEEEAARLVEEYHEEHCGEDIYDHLFLPALAVTNVNRERGKLSEEDAHFIFQVTRELLDDLPAPAQEAKEDSECRTEADRRWQAAPESSVVVLGCPARGEGDELPLEMLGRLLDPAKCRLEVVPAATLSAEILLRVEKEQSAAVVIASLPPRGQTHTRYLCKRLRGRFPQLKILVLYLGREETREQMLRRLREPGADQVATTLEECRSQLLPLVQVLAAAGEPRPAAAVAGNGR